MHKSVMQAQAHTLKDWADLLERESYVGDTTGYSDVIVALRKAAFNIQKYLDPDVKEDLGLQQLPEPTVALEVRDG